MTHPKITFHDKPVLRLLPDGTKHYLEKPWKLGIGVTWLVVPEGFVTDGASQHVYLRYGYGVTEAALAHDYIYRNPSESFSRYETDMLFYTILLQGAKERYVYEFTTSLVEHRRGCDLSPQWLDLMRVRFKYYARVARAVSMFIGVRFGGWGFFEKREKHDK